MHKKFYIAISILLLHFMAIAGQAATRIVTTLSDGVGVTGSLRERIAVANAGDTIVFQTGLSGPISLINQIVINKNININGPGANVIRVSGLNLWRVFNVQAGNVQISGLRITQGFADGAGGGVLVDGGNLTLNNCQINLNDAESGGGALVFPGSTLTITNSTINGNTSAVEGGGVSNRGGTLFLTNTTINGNTAPRGGGVSVENGTATILNSTISGNNTGNSSTSNVGGLRVISNFPQTANVMLKNTIVANNSASFAPIAESDNLQKKNSIENSNFFGVSESDVSGQINSQGNNLIGDNSGAIASFPAGNPNGNGDFVGTAATPLNPLLAALSSNGGTTPTQTLMAGSPAIDAGNNTGAPATDQRGAIRPQGTTVDIGAFETGVPITSGGTGTGSNVNTPLGSVSVTFSGVTQVGTTTQIPISPSAAGTLPGGYSFGAGYPAFDITTTAVYTAPITVCVQVPGVIDMTTFNSLTLLHYEGGVLVDRTVSRDFATQTICATVISLSPFVIAENLAPSAANVSVGGRVLTSGGRGISRAQISITDQNGEIYSAITNSFGYYRFTEIPAGQTYVLSVHHKNYQFNSQVLTISEDIRNVDFTALP